VTINAEDVVNELSLRIAQLERDNAVLRVQLKEWDSKKTKEEAAE
jgi:hypothetical protein